MHILQKKCVLIKNEKVKKVRLLFQEYAPIPAQKAILASITGNKLWNNLRPPFKPLENSKTEILASILEKEFKFKNFKNSQAFVNKVGDIAEKEGHHPDIWFGWGYAKIKIFTHAIKGLHESDFILAAKIDKIV